MHMLHGGGSVLWEMAEKRLFGVLSQTCVKQNFSK